MTTTCHKICEHGGPNRERSVRSKDVEGFTRYYLGPPNEERLVSMCRDSWSDVGEVVFTGAKGFEEVQSINYRTGTKHFYEAEWKDGERIPVALVIRNDPSDGYTGSVNGRLARIEWCKDGVPWIFFIGSNDEGLRLVDLQRPRHTPAHLWGLIKKYTTARNLIVWLQGKVAMRQCAPGGKGRKRDFEAFKEDFGA